ncbi:MAG: insulinase family protein [Myxococcota bacterium]
MFLPLLTALSLAPSVSQAADVPKADYTLNLENYAIDIRDYRFPSGMRVMFQAEHSQPVAAITLVFDRGSEYDQPGYEGIAHVVEHLAFRAQHGDLPKNWDLISQLGGGINASTSNDWTNYMTVAPVDALVPLLRLEALRMKNGVANVTQEDVTKEANIARNELRMRYENSAVGEAWDAIAQLLYPEDHPYYRSTIGNHESLTRMDLEHVQEFVENNYTPENATIVVVGDFELDDTWSFVLAAFDGHLDLLMAPEDAEKYVTIRGEQERIQFLQGWMPKLQQYMVTQTESYAARVDCDARPEPPMPQSQEPVTVRGQVDRTTTVLAWSLPGGYCGDNIIMRAAASNLSAFIAQSIFPDFDPFEDDVSGLGCFAGIDEYNSTLYCFVEPAGSNGLSPERIITKAGDALYKQWDRELMKYEQTRAFLDKSYQISRMSLMTSTLLSVDVVASLGGRATQNAMQTHFTGNPAVFSENIVEFNSLDMEKVQQFAEKYITRDRMVAAIIEPLDKEERQRREAQAAATNSTDSMSYVDVAMDAEDRYSFVFDPETITSETIEQMTITPDTEKLRTFTLDNGLKVAIMPHGEAPLARVGLKVRGGRMHSEPFGLDQVAENLYRTGRGSEERLMAVAGQMYWDDLTFGSEIVVEGSSGNLDALLNKTRWQVEDYDWEMSQKKLTLKRLRGASKRAGKNDPDTWAARIRSERLFEGHPMSQRWDLARFEQAASWNQPMLEEWIMRKWQPANAELFVVGNIDPDMAEASVRKYFDGWTSKSSLPPIEQLPTPTTQPDRQVLIFDNPTGTQSNVTVACQIKRAGARDNAKLQVVGDVLSSMAWRTLREENAVTYGAGAYPVYYQNQTNTAMLFASSLVQNSATGFAVESLLGLIEEGKNGNFPEREMVAAKWNTARSYGLYQQSGSQMLNRLMNTGIDQFDYFDYYPQELGAVDKSAFGEVLAPCVGHEIVTIVGPKEYATAQLDELGMSYEVIDWQSMFEGELNKKELKKYRKAQAKKKAEEEKEANEG